MKQILLPLLFACAVFASPISEHGALSFNSDGTLVDSKNMPYQLRGMSFYWDRWGGEKFHNADVVKTLASTDANTGWGANVIRVPNSNLNVENAKTMIKAAMDNGIYVIMDYHSHCAHKKSTDAESFFGSVAEYVKNSGYSGKVLYEIFNEPVYSNCQGDPNDRGSKGNPVTSWETIKSYAEGVISKIRSKDTQGAILVGTPMFSQGVGNAIDNPIKTTTNVGYVLHFYASESGHASLKNTLIRSRCKKLPIFITEWGTSHADGGGTLEWSMINGWMNLVETLGISWANWSLSSMSESSAALNGGVSTSGGWQEYNLSESGKYVRKLMKGLNAGNSLSSVGLNKETLQSCDAYEGTQTYEFVRDGKGQFGVRFDAENYTDSIGIKTVENQATNAALGMYIQTTTTSGAWASYAMSGVPKESLYTLAIRYNAPNKDVELKYSVDGVIHSVTLPKTSSATVFEAIFTPVTLKAGDVTFKFNLDGISDRDLLFDAFWTAHMDEADSIAFGLKNEDGSINDDFKEPIVGVEESTSSGVHLNMVPVKFSMNLEGKMLILGNSLSNVPFYVLDLQGRVIKSGQINGNRLELSNLPSGQYIVRMYISGDVVGKRISLR